MHYLLAMVIHMRNGMMMRQLGLCVPNMSLIFNAPEGHLTVVLVVIIMTTLSVNKALATPVNFTIVVMVVLVVVRVKVTVIQNILMVCDMRIEYHMCMIAIVVGIWDVLINSDVLVVHLTFGICIMEPSVLIGPKKFLVSRHQLHRFQIDCASLQSMTIVPDFFMRFNVMVNEPRIKASMNVFVRCLVNLTNCECTSHSHIVLYGMHWMMHLCSFDILMVNFVILLLEVVYFAAVFRTVALVTMNAKHLVIVVWC